MSKQSRSGRTEKVINQTTNTLRNSAMGAETRNRDSVLSLQAPKGYRWKPDPKHPDWCKVLETDEGETVGAINRLGLRKLANGAPQDRQRWSISKLRDEPTAEGHRFKEIVRTLATTERAAAEAVKHLLGES